MGDDIMSTYQPTTQVSQTEFEVQRNTKIESQAPDYHPSPMNRDLEQWAGFNPRRLTPVDVTQLQRVIGNRAVGRLLRGATQVAVQAPATVQLKTISPQQTGYRSSALQMRSQLRTSSLNPAKRVVQRKVDTWGGEWDTDKYDLVTPATPGGLRGVDIELRFKPGNNVNAELIGLTQSYRSIKNKNPHFINNDVFYKNRSIQSGDAITVNNSTGETDEGSMIDRVKEYNNPIYPVNSLPSTSLDDTSTSPGWGQHGYHYTNNTGPQHQDAILKDTPKLVNAQQDSGQIFETTALATKGAQAGNYYGSVQWGWRTDSSGNFTKIPLAKVSDGVPSSTFMKSAEIWNASQSSTGANTIDLPIVDVKLTTGTVTLLLPAPMQNIALPVGTRVQIIRAWHPPLLNGEIKVVDGPHTGITGEVSYQEWGNITDERP
jgi:hypothetical protein